MLPNILKVFLAATLLFVINISGYSQCPDFLLTASETKDACFGVDDGRVSVKLSGGTGSYTTSNFSLWLRIGFAYTPIAATSQVFNGDSIVFSSLVPTSDIVPGSNYVVRFTDPGCAGGFVWEIYDNPLARNTEIFANETITGVCAGNDGEILVAPSGGTAPYNLLWTNGPTAIPADETNPTNLDAGSYDLLITDAIGCTMNTTIVVPPAPDATLSASGSTAICVGTTSTIQVAINNGAGPYTVVIDTTGSGTNRTIVGYNSGDNIVIGPSASNTYSLVSAVDNNGCNATVSGSVNITVNPLPSAATNPVDNSYCLGSAPTSISVDDPGAGFRIDWYDANTAGNLVGTGASLTPAAAGTYWAEVVNETTLCTSALRISATLTETPLPADATNPVDNSYCIGGPLVAISVDDPGAGFRVDWYDANTAGNLVGTGASFTPAAAGTYWAEVVDETTLCISATRVSATLTENPLPADATNPVDNAYCTGDPLVAISVDDPGAGFRVDWYDANSAGNLVGTGASFTPAAAGTYWAEVVDETTLCISATRVSATLTEVPLPADALNPVDNSYCQGGVLTAISVDDPGAGFRIDWYDANTAGNLVGTGTSFTPASTGTYWAEVVSISGSCVSANRVSATLTEDPLPADATNPFDNEYCQGGVLTAISVDDPGAGFRVDWYDANTAGNLVGTGALFTPASAGTYWAEVVDETSLCISAARVSATLTENPKPPAIAISGDNNPACQAPGVSYSVTGLPGSTYNWTVPLGASILEPMPYGASITVDFGLNSGDVTAQEIPASGCIGDVTTFNVILQACPFTADFVTDVTEVCINGTVLFTDASSAPIGTNYTWDFGMDASPATENTQGPHSVTYTSTGTKQITLTITNGALTDFVTKSITVTDLPTADLSGDATICPGSSTGLTVNLTGTAPWVFEYTDGVTNFIENINSSPYTINVSPVATTAYTPVLMADALCTGTVLGSALVDITTPKEVTIRLDSIIGTPGSLVKVPLRVIGYEDLMTMQYTISWDPNLLTYNNVSDIVLGNINAGSFGTAEVSNGFLTFSWNTGSLSDTTIVDSTAIFSLEFNVANTLCQDAFVTIDESPTALTPIEIADENLCLANVTIKGGNVENQGVAQITSNDPDNLICFGDQVLFTGLPGGMTNYQFYLNGTEVQNGGNSVYLNSTLVDQDSVNVIVTDAQGCSLDAQGIITTVNQIVISPTVSDITGCGLADGAISLAISGGSGAYSFVWTGPSIVDGSLQDQANLGRGLYSVTVTDDVSGCAQVLDVNLREPVNFTLTTIKNDVTSTGGNDGSIDLTIAGGTGPFTILWNGPNGFTSSSEDISGLYAGTYTATVTDVGEGCTDATIVEILQPMNAIVLNATKTDVTTCGAMDGTINLLITGGSGSFAISWIGPNSYTSNDQNLLGLEGGLYIATVVDLVTTITAQWSVQVDEPEGFVIDAAVTELTYCDAIDGTITLAMTGGSGDFSYAWKDLVGLGFTSTDKDLVDLALGIYRVTVTDNVSGCIDSLDASVGRPAICEQPCALNVESTTNNTSCPDTEDGVAVINIISGGSGPGNYYVSLDTGKTFIPFEGLDITAIVDQGQGSYLYIAKDTVTGCIDQTIANVGVSTNLMANISVSNPGCAEDDGIITFNVSGGIVPFEVDIVDSLGNVTSMAGNGFFQFMDLTAGSYFYAVREQSGCSIVASDSIELRVDCISGCSSLIASAHSFEDATCGSDPNGKAIFDVTGGSSPYEYTVDGVNWIPFISGNVVDQLPPNGTYNIAIRQDVDNADCRAEVPVTINGPELIVLETPIITTQKATCNQNDGAVKVGRVAGGIQPYSYQIDGAPFVLAADSIIIDLGAGMHTFSVVDAVGCQADFVFEVESPGVIVAAATDVPVSCTSIFLKAGIRIEVDLDLTTLPGPYEAYVATTADPDNGTLYQIPDNGIRTILNLDKDFYTVTITSGEDGGCAYSETISVFSGASPVDFEIIDSDSIVSCIGDIGSITIGNVVGDQDTTFIVQLISESNVILETYELYLFEFEGGFTIDENISTSLVAGKYYIKIIQNQNECANVEAISELITIYEPLGLLEFVVIEDEVSLQDRPTGSIIGEVKPSGGEPYEALIQLIEPVFEMNITDIIEFNENRDWEEVTSTGGNLNQFLIQFDTLWAGRYEIAVQDGYGCEFVLEHSIGYDETVFIPNVFTPNNDGFNDTFYIRNLPESGTQVVISNRNGFVVYKSDDYNYNSLWDGGDLADGIYYYNVSMPSGETYKGWVEKWSGARP